jgi:hypothetical protein
METQEALIRFGLSEPRISLASSAIVRSSLSPHGRAFYRRQHHFP